MMKRVKKNDPAALCRMGREFFNEGDCGTALIYLTKAAKLEDTYAHAQLGAMYEYSLGVEKDMEKAVCHYEKAAIGGHPKARYMLGCYEERSGNTERAAKHFIIAAKLGDDESMRDIWKHYFHGNISKEDLDATLRTHQAAIDEMKSEQRDVAERYFRMTRGIIRYKY
jgi:TPR repeat protein